MTSKNAIEYYLNIAKDIEQNIDFKKYSYTIHDNVYFEGSITHNTVEMNKIYWEEILQRGHWAALTSIIRNLQWVKGTEQAISENNLLSFCANLRCLIESSGDNVLSLLSVPQILAENFKNIKDSLNETLSNKTVYISDELEEILIHFSYARKISKEERINQPKIPKYQNAKPASEYLKKLDNKIENGPVAELYSILCQFAHPAAHSIHYLLDLSYDSEIYKFAYSQNADKKYIDRILNAYKNEIFNILQQGFNPGFLTLKALNLFPYELTKTPYFDTINLRNIKAWIDIENKISLQLTKENT
ncbi:hypothetical protein [Chryseobacterium viscerum]|uniref:Uncharacterized protein n=1 Tax=Chryseobacterium viscerum TaxID=1037377 RepID=A0A316WFZ9_9FLAO|nr:hypothetical protein [Chryseobacterium viscerum]PWN57928.1 hypothetical protein C1634_025370 [Chryseobacterium viscerum]